MIINNIDYYVQYSDINLWVLKLIYFNNNILIYIYRHKYMESISYFYLSKQITIVDAIILYKTFYNISNKK